MQFTPLAIAEVVLVTPKVFGDERGFFMEMYHQGRFSQHGIDPTFVQENLSRSSRGVLRGMHYQIQHAQGKLVTVLAGEIFDVAVDIRRTSPTFGQWVGVSLDAKLRQSLYIPAGFAHGFYVLSESADVCYKCTDLYHPEHERIIQWNDPAIGIEWPLIAPPTLSAKDQAALPLAAAECYS